MATAAGPRPKIIGELPENNTLGTSTDDIFHQEQIDGALCGMYAINHVLQEEKCIYDNSRPNIEFIIPGVPGVPATSATRDQFRIDPDVKYNTAHLCQLNPDYCRGRQWFSQDALSHVLKDGLGYNVINKVLRERDRGPIIPTVDKWVDTLLRILSSPGFIGAVINRGNSHWVAITIGTNKCWETGERDFTYIDSFGYHDQNGNHYNKVLCLGPTEIGPFLATLHGRILGYIAVHYPHTGSNHYICQAIRNVASFGKSQPIPPEFLDVLDTDMSAVDFNREYDQFIRWVQTQTRINQAIIRQIINPAYTKYRIEPKRGNNVGNDRADKVAIVKHIASLLVLKGINVDSIPISPLFKSLTYTDTATVSDNNEGREFPLFIRNSTTGEEVYIYSELAKIDKKSNTWTCSSCEKVNPVIEGICKQCKLPRYVLELPDFESVVDVPGPRPQLKVGVSDSERGSASRGPSARSALPTPPPPTGLLTQFTKGFSSLFTPSPPPAPEKTAIVTATKGANVSQKTTPLERRHKLLELYHRVIQPKESLNQLKYIETRNLPEGNIIDAIETKIPDLKDFINDFATSKYSTVDDLLSLVTVNVPTTTTTVTNSSAQLIEPAVPKARADILLHTPTNPDPSLIDQLKRRWSSFSDTQKALYRTGIIAGLGYAAIHFSRTRKGGFRKARKRKTRNRRH